MPRPARPPPLRPERAATLRPLLDGLDARLDREARIAADPVELPRRYADPLDQEVAALFAACLAYGRADLFKPLVARLLEAMGPSPAVFVRAFARAPDPAAFPFPIRSGEPLTKSHVRSATDLASPFRIYLS